MASAVAPSLLFLIVFVLLCTIFALTDVFLAKPIFCSMDHIHYAAIDIGSNAVRLLIKRLDDPKKGRFSKDVLLRVPLRLGQEVFTEGSVSEQKLHDLTEVMKAFALVMGVYQVSPSNRRICATASLREAANADAVVRHVKEVTGLDIEVISGHEEASIVCSLHAPGDERSLVYVDVGGGSTEISLMSGGRTIGRRSFPIGTIRILNNVAIANWHILLTDFLREMAADFLGCPVAQARMPEAVMVGAGGNINKLFALAQERDADEHSMTVGTLQSLYDTLAPLSVEQRMVKYKLKADRADVIVPAADIFLTIARALDIGEVEIPSDGLADGIIADIWAKQHQRAT